MTQPQNTSLTHDEMMMLISLNKKAAKIMFTLSENEDAPFYTRLVYRRYSRQLEDSTNLSRRLVFSHCVWIIDGSPRCLLSQEDIKGE